MVYSPAVEQNCKPEFEEHWQEDGIAFQPTFHCSRHTWATLTLNKSVDLNIISTLMGHSSSWITGKVYAKYLPKTIATEVNEKLNFKF